MYTTLLYPESILHIYYLEGTIPKSHDFHHKGFVGNWEEDGFSFLFYLEPATDEIASLQHQYPHLQLLDSYEMTYADWQGGSIEPVTIGRFVLQPPWEKNLSKPVTFLSYLTPAWFLATAHTPPPETASKPLKLPCTVTKCNP